ncbi:MAG: hypothetical protein JWO43_660 [Candidatus Adlerbacteria bacterium]|nr:hypothetical protein [Candidatus Adlerbacteria bacterium]
MDVAINYWAVLGAALASFVVGWAWFSPLLFMKPWMRMSGVKMGEGGGTKGMIRSMVIMFVCSLLTAYVLAHFIALLAVTTVNMALQLGFWVWLGFYATMQLGPYLWEGKPFQLYLIQAGQTLVTTLVMAAILGVWH